MHDVLEDVEAYPPEDGDQNHPPVAAGGQESPGNHLRDRIAAHLPDPPTATTLEGARLHLMNFD